MASDSDSRSNLKVSAMRTSRAISDQNRVGTQSRPGAVVMLVTFFLVVFVAMGAFSIDAAYMQLVKTQLRAATDSAAKAGTAALVKGQSDAGAKSAAIAMAAKNMVAGHALYLTTADVVVGQSQLQADGTWKFVAGATPSQAVQVNSKLYSTNANGAVPLFFAPVLGVPKFQTQETSVASAFACEVSLCLDRSGSMKWDLSGTNYMYPSPYFSNYSKGDSNPPQPGSRWYALRDAVKSFTNILTTAKAPPRVGVATWATDTKLDLGLSTDMTAVYNAVNSYTSKAFTGSTNMQGGMQTSVNLLTGATSRSYARKIMILMSDGDWNAGTDPVVYATTAKSLNITIHTISFLASGTGANVLSQIASITGGKFYVASDAASLTAAFQELAYSLPVVLTE